MTYTYTTDFDSMLSEVIGLASFKVKIDTQFSGTYSPVTTITATGEIAGFNSNNYINVCDYSDAESSAPIFSFGGVAM